MPACITHRGVASERERKNKSKLRRSTSTSCCCCSCTHYYADTAGFLLQWPWTCVCESTTHWEAMNGSFFFAFFHFSLSHTGNFFYGYLGPGCTANRTLIFDRARFFSSTHNRTLKFHFVWPSRSVIFNRCVRKIKLFFLDSLGEKSSSSQKFDSQSTTRIEITLQNKTQSCAFMYNSA